MNAPAASPYTLPAVEAGRMRHIISILLENEAGALSRVAGLFSARGYNIESLTVAPTEDASLSRMTIVTIGSDNVIEQITKQLNKLIEVVKVVDLSEAAHERFNRGVNEHFEGTRDYIVTHYKTNTRQDTEYWRANAANMNLSDDLKKLYAMWMAGKSIAPAVGQQLLGKGYPVFSWYSIMAGMGIFPDPHELRPATPQEARFSMAEIDNLLARSSANYPDHRDALGGIAPRRTDPSLQIYFW